MKKLISICACFVVFLFRVGGAEVLQLPQLGNDEDDLLTLLEDAVIDSFQYEQLLNLYAMPLSVPQGEHFTLSSIFPGIEEFLPSIEKINEYHPFDNRQIQKLFTDFPVLADFAPVLRFNAPESRPGANGEIIIGVNRASISELRGHSVRFRANGSRVTFHGNTQFSDTSVLWRTRRVDLSLPYGVSAQVGNFAQPINGDLFWGRFSSFKKEDDGDIILDNWLYGGSNTWNGFFVRANEIPRAQMLGVKTFYHARGDENVIGAEVDVRIRKQTSVSTAISAYKEMTQLSAIFIPDELDDDNGDDDDDTVADSLVWFTDEKFHYTAHLYGEHRFGAWRTIGEAALPLDGENIMPALSWRLIYRPRETSAEYRFIRYPKNFNAPMSRVKRRLFNEIGMRESPDANAIQKHSFKTIIPVETQWANAIRLTPEFDFTEHMGIVERVHGKADIRARFNSATITLGHATRFFATENDSAVHTSRANFNLQIPYSLEFRGAGQSTYGHVRNVRNTYTFETVYTALPGINIAPFFRGRYTGVHEYFIGVRTELHLQRRTWTNVTIEFPTGVKGDEHVYIRASASYAF